MFQLTRRDLVLSAVGAEIAFGLNKSVAFIGAAQAQQAAAVPFRKHTVGELEVYSLVDGLLELPPRDGFIRNANAEQIKTALRSSGLSDAVISIPFTAMAVRMRDRLVLIDTGTGGFPIYGPNSGKLRQSMAAAGLDPADVKTILISHLHGDHIYGLLDKDTKAQTLPNAEIVVPAAELAWWIRPEVDGMDLGPTRKGLSQLIRTTIATWKNVRQAGPDEEPLPGIRAIPASGHSPGMTAYLLSSGNRQLLITADASLLPALFVRNPHWQIALDQDPNLAVETRRRLFDQVVADKLLVTGTHWPLPNIGTMVKDGSGYVFAPEA
jgi:glyoxylase-like metal-dependent hydrolase (beta-lactamase superfamily II)